MLTQAYKSKLDTCHPDLIRLFTAVAEAVPTCIICGWRSDEDQNQAFLDGKSRKKGGESKHNLSPSEACDAGPLIDNQVPWKDRKAWEDFASIVRKKAFELKIRIRWGGDYPHLVDLAHWELIK